MQRVWLTLALSALFPALALAQPTRQMPGSRPFLPGTPRYQVPEPNSRTKAAASATGLESTDFYPKNGYPKVLGDAVEAGSASGGAAGGGSAGLSGGGSAGVTGGSLGSGGGGSLGGGSLGGGGTGTFSFSQPGSGVSITGGAFSGVIPKGFGFGGVPDPDFNHTWLQPRSSGKSK